MLLQDALVKIQRRKKVGHSTLYHLVGKLNWFAEVLQSGRVHKHSFWNFLWAGVEVRAPAAELELLLLDIAWWI